MAAHFMLSQCNEWLLMLHDINLSQGNFNVGCSHGSTSIITEHHPRLYKSRFLNITESLTYENVLFDLVVDLKCNTAYLMSLFDGPP